MLWKKLSNASGKGAQGLAVTILEQDLTEEGKEGWTDQGYGLKGIANGTKKEQPGGRRKTRRM